ncbi:MAG: hypothetical protein KJO32_05705 [Deltaproteobacteria bacterium]|nr:hypothetical protein [Deltaproteobacteria bacterium]
MGGFGSGTWIRSGTKGLTEHQQRIDTKDLNKTGLLTPGRSGILSWRNRLGETTGSVSYKISDRCMTLKYSYLIENGELRQQEDQAVPVILTVLLDRTPMHFGGYRTWFLCPDCNRRCRVLYGSQKLFLCRNCSNLAYASQNEDKVSRLILRSRKIRKKLGNNDDITQPMGSRPRYMHRSTYERLVEEAETCAELAVTLLYEQCQCRGLV